MTIGYVSGLHEGQPGEPEREIEIGMALQGRGFVPGRKRG